VTALAFAILAAHPVGAWAKKALPKLKTFDKGDLRQATDAVNKKAFHQQLRAALKSPDHLLRSFPRQFWRSVKRVPAEELPGKVGFVLGDAGVENLGFVRAIKHGREKTVFGLNDFDDPGRGPVALDADHLFAELRLRYPGKTRLIDKLIERYVEAVGDPKAVVDVDRRLAPEWEKVRAHELKKLTKGDAFNYKNNHDLAPESGEVRQAIERALPESGRLSHLKILDVAAKARASGGSGGLPRRLLLVEAKGERSVLEMKEAGEPGVNELDLPGQLSMDQRLTKLKQVFWGTRDKGDWFYLTVGGKRFLLRDRMDMEGLDLAALSKKERRNVLAAMVGYVAEIHRSGWVGTSAQEMTDHLSKGSAELAKIYTKAWKELK
jgi:hypothetical protein